MKIAKADYTILPIHNLIPHSVWGSMKTGFVDHVVFMGNYFRMGQIEVPPSEGIVDDKTEFEFYLRELDNLRSALKEDVPFAYSILLGRDDLKVLYPQYRQDYYDNVPEDLLQKAQQSLFDLIEDFDVYLGAEFMDDYSSLLYAPDWCGVELYHDIKSHISVNNLTRDGGSPVNWDVLRSELVNDLMEPTDYNQSPVCRMVCNSDTVEHEIDPFTANNGMDVSVVNRVPRTKGLDCPLSYSKPYNPDENYHHDDGSKTEASKKFQDPGPKTQVKDVVLEEMPKGRIDELNDWYTQDSTKGPEVPDQEKETAPNSSSNSGPKTPVLPNYDLTDIPDYWTTLVLKANILVTQAMYVNTLRKHMAEIGFYSVYSAIMSEEYGHYTMQVLHECILDSERFLRKLVKDKGK